ncbi:TlpA family protein disulfide reductase [Leptospira sp. WS92.C1]
MKEVLKKGTNIGLWILLFLTITISISIFRASDLKPSVFLSGMNLTEGEKYDSKNRVSIVYFWATWCGVCSTNLPLVRWYADGLENSSRFSFVTVEEGENFSELSDYIRKHQLKFAVIPGNSQLLKEWKVGGFPSFFILDKSGTIRFADSGMMNPLSFLLRIWIVYFFF